MLVSGRQAGADSGEVKWVNFHPPFSEPPSFFFFSYPSNIEIIFDFSDIITKIHPPFQNPGSALAFGQSCMWYYMNICELHSLNFFDFTGRVCHWSCLKVSLWENVQMDCFKNQQVAWQNKAWRCFIHWHSRHCRIWNFPGKLIAMIVMPWRFAGKFCLLKLTSTLLITF